MTIGRPLGSAGVVAEIEKRLGRTQAPGKPRSQAAADQQGKDFMKAFWSAAIIIGCLASAASYSEVDPVFGTSG